MATTIANNAADMEGHIVMVADSATPRTVTDLFTFNRGSNPPFLVIAGATGVDNLLNWKVLAPTTVGNQNNYSPGTAGNTLIKCNNAALLTITGLTGGIDGELMTFLATNARVDFVHNSGASGATNRFVNLATSGNTSIMGNGLLGGGWATYQYSAATTAWHLVSHDQGPWLTPTYAAGDFTGAGGLTWAVQAGDVVNIRYRLAGRTLTVNYALATTSTGGAAANALLILNGQWGGFTAVTQADNSLATALDNGARTDAWVEIVAGGATLNNFRSNGANWSNASVNATELYGQISFEVN